MEVVDPKNKKKKQLQLVWSVNYYVTELNYSHFMRLFGHILYKHFIIDDNEGDMEKILEKIT